ncbi:MAG: hypothetical protein ACRDD7_06370 [Peptostreptococcaceae bacterium]
MVNLIVGASGSGKDYAVNVLCNMYHYKKVISRTTRKPRFQGEDTHLFVTYRQARNEFNREDVIAKTIYNSHKYYVLPSDLEGKDFYIIDPNGVKSMDKDKYDKVMFIKCSVWTRFKNMRKRGDKLKDIIQRLLLDRKEFKNFKGNIEFKSSDELIEYFIDRRGNV